MTNVEALNLAEGVLRLRADVASSELSSRRLNEAARIMGELAALFDPQSYQWLA